MLLPYFSSLFIGYLFGSVSFAVIIAQSRGIDIFKEGSGNPGATNVKRVLGKKAGNLVFALDFLKGFLAVLIVSIVFGKECTLCPIITLIMAIIGHSFSIFLKFRGGKGVAVTMGGLLALVPLVLLASVLTWLVVFYTLRYVSLASIVFGLSLHLWALAFDKGLSLVSYSKPTYVLLILLGLLILVRHKSNLERLINGTESRFAKNKTSSQN